MQLFDYTLGEILEKWAFETPEEEFIVYPDRDLHFSYKQFNQRVDNLAKGLLYLGTKPGDKIAVWAGNIPDWTTFMFATTKIGAVLVPINTNYKKTEIEYLFKNADISTLCVAEGHKGVDFLTIVDELIPEIKESGREDLKSEKFPELRNVVFMGQQKQKGMYNTTELMLLGSHVDDIELESIQALVNCNDTTLILYTSGTTGLPKGAELTHHNILNNAYSVGQCIKYTSNDKLLVCIPLFHSFGCILAVCGIITHGATLVFTEEFDPQIVLASIQKEKCTALYGVPTMFIEELNHLSFETYDLSSLRTGIMSGAPCPVETMNAVMSKMHLKDLIIVYGMAETSPGVTATRAHNSAATRASTIGFELPNVQVKLVNPETGNDCNTGEQGEILCKGYNLMKSYYKNPVATRKVLDEDGWLHTGDLAVKSEDGFYKITGRITDMIIKGGESIYPREIENHLYKLSQIENVEIVGIPSPKYGERIVAFVKLKEGESLTVEDVKSFCAENIARFKVPGYVFFVDSFPKSANEKTQKFKLSELAILLCTEKGIKII